jgi:hypothetical protein
MFHVQGGAGFYTSDISNKDRLFEVRPEKILVLECLGPPESDWNLQSFQVFFSSSLTRHEVLRGSEFKPSARLRLPPTVHS